LVSTNPTTDPSEVQIDCYDEFSNLIGTKNYVLLDREYKNVNINNIIGAGIVNDINCDVQTIQGFVYVGASVVDNRSFSGDQVFIPELDTEPKPISQVIPGVASTLALPVPTG
jgi:hypothetical protein